MKKPNLSTFILFTVLTAAFLGGVYYRFFNNSADLFGYKFLTVLSGSMEPTFKTGSIIAVQPLKAVTKHKAGEIITYKSQSQSILITHRIISISEENGMTSYTTKGDNNKNADPVKVYPEDIYASYRNVTIPYIGFVLAFVMTKPGIVSVIILPLTFLITYLLYRFVTKKYKANKI